MLIDSYKIELCEPECVAEARGAIYSAKVHFPDGISEVMPYLNAVLDKPEYSGNYQFIVWRDTDRAFALRPRELAISSVTDRRNAQEVADKVVAMINNVWERKGEITPDFERKTRPQALAVFKLLPGTNCGECGLPGCMAFAVELARGDRTAGECTPLLEPDNEDALDELERLGINR